MFSRGEISRKDAKEQRRKDFYSFLTMFISFLKAERHLRHIPLVNFIEFGRANEKSKIAFLSDFAPCVSA